MELIEYNKVNNIIVIGNRLKNNLPSKLMISRLNKALELYNKCPNARIIVSGGSFNNDKSEALFMKEWLVNKGVLDNRIIMEDKSRTTRQNFLYSKMYINNNDINVIVTNEFHMKRSILIAKKVGISNVKGCCTSNDGVSFYNKYIKESFLLLIEKIL